MCVLLIDQDVLISECTDLEVSLYICTCVQTLYNSTVYTIPPFSFVCSLASYHATSSAAANTQQGECQYYHSSEDRGRDYEYVPVTVRTGLSFAIA